MLEQKLENRDIKPTAMRFLVLRQLVESGSAIGLPDLEVKFERADKATLYRTLKTFEEKNLFIASQMAKTLCAMPFVLKIASMIHMFTFTANM